MRLPLAKSMTAARSFFLHDQRNTAWLRLPDCRVDGHAPASAARASSVGNRWRQSPISVSRIAARMVPERGRLENVLVRMRREHPGDPGVQDGDLFV